MQPQMITLATDSTIVIIGRAGTLSEMPKSVRPRDRALAALRDLDHAAMMRLRSFLASMGLQVRAVSDRELIGVVRSALQHRRLQIASFPRILPERVTTPAALMAGNVVAAPSVVPVDVRSMPMADRFGVVIHRAAAKIPDETANLLRGIATAENLAAMALLAAFGIGMQFTPYGWVADVVLAGLAYAFAGYAGVLALRDVAMFLTRTINAETEADLDAAAESLAKGVVVLGTVGLMAIIGRLAKRTPTNGQEDAVSSGAAQTRPAFPARQPAPPSGPVPRAGPTIQDFAPMPPAPASRATIAALKKQGYDLQTAGKIADSGRTFRMVTGRKGDRMYAFHNARENKAADNPFWLTEKDYLDLARQFRDPRTGAWDSTGVKHRLALPCWNAADRISVGQLGSDQQMMQSTINAAKEKVIHAASDNTESAFWRLMAGGGSQTAPRINTITDIKVLGGP